MNDSSTQSSRKHSVRQSPTFPWSYSFHSLVEVVKISHRADGRPVDTPIVINVTSRSRCRSDARGASVHKQDVWKEHVFENIASRFFSFLYVCMHRVNDPGMKAFFVPLYGKCTQKASEGDGTTYVGIPGMKCRNVILSSVTPRRPS